MLPAYLLVRTEKDLRGGECPDIKLQKFPCQRIAPRLFIGMLVSY